MLVPGGYFELFKYWYWSLSSPARLCLNLDYSLSWPRPRHVTKRENLPPMLDPTSFQDQRTTDFKCCCLLTAHYTLLHFWKAHRISKKLLLNPKIFSFTVDSHHIHPRSISFFFRFLKLQFFHETVCCNARNKEICQCRVMALTLLHVRRFKK